MDYRGKITIVTGASSGIGYVTAKAFARRGSTLVAVARREALLRRLIGECAAQAPKSQYIAGDLADRAVRRALDERAILGEELVLDPIHRHRDVAATVHVSVERPAVVDHEGLDLAAVAGQDELLGAAGRDLIAAGDEDQAVDARIAHASLIADRAVRWERAGACGRAPSWYESAAFPSARSS